MIKGNSMHSQSGHIDSHYSATAAHLPTFGQLASAKGTHAQVCIIGGGLAGLTAALELARAGRDVILLEGKRMGWAASGRNGGFVSGGFAESILTIEKRLGLDHARELYRLSVEGVGHIRNTIRENAREDIIGGQGWLKMIRHARVAELEQRAERMARDYGVQYTLLSQRELEPYVSSNSYHAGLLDMGPFHIQPLDYAVLLAGQAAAHGARLHENSRVISIERLDGGNWEVRTGNGSVRCEHVVVATSAYGGPVQRINRAILPVATYVVTARSQKLDEAIRFSGCLGDTRRAGDYYRIVGKGDERRLLWGGRITTRTSVPARLGEALKRDIQGVYPQLDDLVIERKWAGLMGYCVHKMPLIGQMMPGLWPLTGFGGHGLNTTAMGGYLIASAITGGDDRWRLFEPFRVQWGGGLAGRVATQLEYWRLQIADRFEEMRAGK
ncbi:MAG: FAD-binding oxidoreductase [Rhizobiaceae bacterium]